MISTNLHWEIIMRMIVLMNVPNCLLDHGKKWSECSQTSEIHNMLQSGSIFQRSFDQAIRGEKGHHWSCCISLDFDYGRNSFSCCVPLKFFIHYFTYRQVVFAIPLAHSVQNIYQVFQLKYFAEYAEHSKLNFAPRLETCPVQAQFQIQVSEFECNYCKAVFVLVKTSFWKI